MQNQNEKIVTVIKYAKLGAWRLLTRQKLTGIKLAAAKNIFCVYAAFASDNWGVAFREKIFLIFKIDCALDNSASKNFFKTLFKNFFKNSIQKSKINIINNLINIPLIHNIYITLLLFCHIFSHFYL